MAFQDKSSDLGKDKCALVHCFRGLDPELVVSVFVL